MAFASCQQVMLLTQVAQSIRAHVEQPGWSQTSCKIRKKTSCNLVDDLLTQILLQLHPLNGFDSEVEAGDSGPFSLNLPVRREVAVLSWKADYLTEPVKPVRPGPGK
ncbi:unnamed protein product [Arctogadus glacialis]